MTALAHRYLLRLLLAATFFLLCQAALASTDFVVPPGIADQPDGIVTGPDGNLWFVNANGRTVGRLTPAGTFTSFAVPGALVMTRITVGGDGALWFTDDLSDTVGRITTTGQVTTFPLAAGSFPLGITLGPDGAVWFCELESNKIGRITPAGVVTEFDVSANHGPSGITTGPDENLWFTGSAGIGILTTSGALTTYPTDGGGVFGQIVTGPDGRLWFPLPGAIGQMTTTGTFTFTFTNVPVGQNIAVGPDGNLWFDVSGGSQIARMTVAGVETDFTIRPNVPVSIGGITSGPNGALWVTDSRNSTIYRVSTAGMLTAKFQINRGAEPEFITNGPDGNLWFTDINGQIGKITPQGSVTTYPVAQAACPYFITAGSDGAMWFTDNCLSQIDRITTQGQLSIFPITTPNAVFPNGIASGSDGNLWVAIDTGGVERFTPTVPPIETHFPLPLGSEPFEIVSGPDGNLWITDEYNEEIDRLTPTGQASEFPTIFQNPLNEIPEAIASGPDGNLWFTMFTFSSKDPSLGRIETSGNITLFPSSLRGFNLGITAGADGVVWVAARGSHFGIVPLYLDGTRGAYIAPTYPAGEPNGIVTGPDHKLWFAQTLAARIGRMSAIHGNGATLALQANQAFSGPVVNFIDGTPTATIGDFWATIDWGDGSAATSGTVTGNMGGPFTVNGNHVYSSLGNFTIKVTLHEMVDNADYVAAGTVSVTTTTATALMTSANPAAAGGNVTFTATVTAPAGVASGSVQFEDFGSVIGTVALNGSGVATFMTSSLAAGPHEISAVYVGDGLHAGSTSNTVDEIITTAGQAPTTTALSPSKTFLTGALEQRSVMLTATVTTGGATATGTVSFYSGTRLLGQQTLNNSGQASITTGELNVGGNEVTAAYSGDTNFAASISPVAVVYRSPKPR